MDAYFNVLHHTREDEGVDFWWLDWQQGRFSKSPGIDPLWMLNHFHFLDSGRNSNRPLTFSRYAGPGSHRYPIGFSGVSRVYRRFGLSLTARAQDTQVTWESLQFQPEFTATASNIGYGWWSHDIGGHFHGYKASPHPALIPLLLTDIDTYRTMNLPPAGSSLGFGPPSSAYIRISMRLMPESRGVIILKHGRSSQNVFNYDIDSCPISTLWWFEPHSKVPHSLSQCTTISPPFPRHTSTVISFASAVNSSFRRSRARERGRRSWVMP